MAINERFKHGIKRLKMVHYLAVRLKNFRGLAYSDFY
jgi:hypothetical protein